ncbi:MAG: hypothetical protein HKN58_09550 [Xanthomonadales bacterium]|nr:hypothetical protein [Xanthomonadales bacterium]
MFFPVTAMYAGLLGLLLILLSAQVSRQRRRARVSLGLGGDTELERAARAQGNFIEYVPLGLLLLLLLEPEITRLWILHVLGTMLLLGRILHAIGMYPRGRAIKGRFWGTALTWLMILGASFLNLWHQL